MEELLNYNGIPVYSKHDECLHSAVVACKPTEKDAILVSDFNKAYGYDLKKAESGETFGYACSPVRGYIAELKNDVPSIRETSILRPVHDMVFECKDEVKAESYFVNANIYGYIKDGIDRRSNVVFAWKIPFVWLPYSPNSEYYVQDIMRCISDSSKTNQGTFDSYEFGQKYGNSVESITKGEIVTKRMLAIVPQNIDQFSFTLRDFPDNGESMEISLKAMNLIVLESSRKAFIKARDKGMCQGLASLIECYGDLVHKVLCHAEVRQFPCGRLISLAIGKNNEPELVTLTTRCEQCGRVPILHRIKLTGILRDVIVRNKSYDFIEVNQKSNTVTLFYLDKTVDYDMNKLFELLNFGTTKKSNAISTKAVLSGKAGDLEIWADGTLKKAKPSESGDIIIPKEVTKVAERVFADASNLKRVVLSENIKLISKKAFTDSATKIEHIEFKFEKPTLKIVQQFVSALSKCYYQVTPNLYLDKRNYAYNAEVMFLLFSVCQSVVKPFPSCLVANGWYAYFSPDALYNFVKSTVDYVAQEFAEDIEITMEMCERAAKNEYIKRCVTGFDIVPKWYKAYIIFNNLLSVITRLDLNTTSNAIPSADMAKILTELERCIEAYMERYKKYYSTLTSYPFCDTEIKHHFSKYDAPNYRKSFLYEPLDNLRKYRKENGID